MSACWVLHKKKSGAFHDRLALFTSAKKDWTFELLPNCGHSHLFVSEKWIRIMEIEFAKFLLTSIVRHTSCVNNVQLSVKLLTSAFPAPCFI